MPKRVSWWRRASRWLSGRALGSDVMFCAEMHRRRHWAERWLDWAFRPWGRGHCANCSAWEAWQIRETSALDDWRENGWL